jgi:hypothetical protein
MTPRLARSASAPRPPGAGDRASDTMSVAPRPIPATHSTDSLLQAGHKPPASACQSKAFKAIHPRSN